MNIRWQGNSASHLFFIKVTILACFYGFLCMGAVSGTKIIGLLQVRDEEFFIEQCLRSLAYYTDAIVIVDDASTDNTVKIVESLKDELHVERIIKNTESAWQTKDERYNRELLLNTGRAIGGTHFIFMDADEMFSAQCAKDNWLRNKILSMQKGQVLRFYEINLWNGIEYYRIDEPFDLKTSSWGYKPFVFCDDGVCNYQDNKFWSTSQTIHFSVVPINRKTGPGVKKDIYYQELDKAVLHFNTVNLDRIYDKRIWYMCFEFIRLNQNSTPDQYKENAKKINNFYTKTEFVNLHPTDKSKIQLAPALTQWFAGYTFFNSEAYKKYHPTRRNEVLHWFKKYGIEYFKDLDIWYLDWTKKVRTMI